MLPLGLCFALLYASDAAFNAPVLDCKTNKNTRWCGSILRRGNAFFCETKLDLSKQVCRKLWCEKCPQQYAAAVAALKQQSLFDQLSQDVRWKEVKAKFKSEFEKLGLGYLFSPAPSKDQNTRYEAFVNATDEIEAIKKQATETDEPMEFEVDINKFALMKEGHAGMKLPTDLKPKDAPDIPTSWRDKIYVNGGTDWRPALQSVKEIKDQGFCGCCWAFTASQTLESAYEIESGGDLVEFSPEDLLDCSSNGINKGCDGGLAHYAFEYVRDNGIEAVKTYPYTSFQRNTGKESCHHSKTKVKTFVDGFDYFYSGDTTVNKNFNSTASDEALMKTLDVMPVAGAIAAGSIFLYKRGIYNNRKCQGPLNHAVLIVGYGTSKKGTPYWIIKNTWGNSWGEGGYMRIKRGNYCGVGQYWAIPKTLSLCPKFAQADCTAHTDCQWYGDSCGVKGENCVHHTTGPICEFYGCYWKADSSKCMRPTAKCVLDTTLQSNETACAETPHCEWLAGYGNCQVKSTTCSATDIATCEANYCTRSGQTCGAWSIYQCSAAFTDQSSCESMYHCEWYNNKCSFKACKKFTTATGVRSWTLEHGTEYINATGTASIKCGINEVAKLQCAHGKWTLTSGGQMSASGSIYSKTPSANYDTSKEYCLDRCGSLATIHSALDQQLVSGVAGGLAWIGLYKDASGGRSDPAGLRWVDGSAVDYLNLYPNQPDCDGCGMTCNCVSCFEINYNGNQWNDSPCSSSRPAVCMFALTLN